MYHLLGIPEQDGQTISTQHLMSPQQLPSPLKEHVWCCFMLQEIATLLNNQITTDKLHEVLQHCSDSKVKPSLFDIKFEVYKLKSSSLVRIYRRYCRNIHLIQMNSG